MRPQRIILVQHGESDGNLNRSIYAERPDYSLELTKDGKAQAAGEELTGLIGERIMFYASPPLAHAKRAPLRGKKFVHQQL